MTARAARNAAGLVAALLAVACAQNRPQVRVMTLTPAPAELFDASAPIEVTDAATIAELHGPVASGSADGVGTGMAQGAGGAIAGGASTGFGIFLAPVFAVVGGVYGAAAAHPAAETDAAIAAIEEVYRDQDLLSGVAAAFEARASGLGFPAAPPCNGIGEGAVQPAPAGCPPAAANRLSLTVTYSFSTTGTFSPDLRFGIDAAAVATNADGTRDPTSYRWVYLSPDLDFFTVTRDNATGLREALADAQRQLAVAIIDDLFLVRREVQVSGIFYPSESGQNFHPTAVAAGKATRVPTDPELINVPPASLREPPPRT